MSLQKAIDYSPRTARSRTFDIALTMLNSRYGDKPVNIVETGTIRQEFDPGDGWSTLVWDSYVNQFGGKVWTCDLNSLHMEVCRRVTRESPRIEYVVGDSLKFLKDFKEKINFLYLDSYDTGGTEENIKNACIHQLNEAKNALDRLDENALIMLDDIPTDYKGGKGELSIPFFLENGFKVLHYQEPQMILGK
jgi:hypothetical protein